MRLRYINKKSDVGWGCWYGSSTAQHRCCLKRIPLHEADAHCSNLRASSIAVIRHKKVHSCSCRTSAASSSGTVSSTFSMVTATNAATTAMKRSATAFISFAVASLTSNPLLGSLARRSTGHSPKKQRQIARNEKHDRLTSNCDGGGGGGFGRGGGPGGGPGGFGMLAIDISVPRMANRGVQKASVCLDVIEFCRWDAHACIRQRS
jgi:hypothetical protein